MRLLSLSISHPDSLFVMFGRRHLITPTKDIIGGCQSEIIMATFYTLFLAWLVVVIIAVAVERTIRRVREQNRKE